MDALVQSLLAAVRPELLSLRLHTVTVFGLLQVASRALGWASFRRLIWK
jgi:hypothetical protein